MGLLVFVLIKVSCRLARVSTMRFCYGVGGEGLLVFVLMKVSCRRVGVLGGGRGRPRQVPSCFGVFRTDAGFVALAPEYGSFSAEVLPNSVGVASWVLPRRFFESSSEGSK